MRGCWEEKPRALPSTLPLRPQTLVNYFKKPTAFQARSKPHYYFLDVLKPPPLQIQWAKVLSPCQRLEEGRDERQSRDRRRLRGLGWTIHLTPSPSLGKGWPQGLLNHNHQALTSSSEGRRLTPLQQPRQAQHAPLSERFHPPTASRKVPREIPATLHMAEDSLHTQESGQTQPSGRADPQKLPFCR